MLVEAFQFFVASNDTQGLMPASCRINQISLSYSTYSHVEVNG